MTLRIAPLGRRAHGSWMALVVVASWFNASAAGGWEAEPSSRERREVARLVAAYRKAAKTPKEQDELAKSLVARGAYAAAELGRAVRSALEKDLQRYERSVLAAASKVAARRRRGQDSALRELRATIFATANGRGLDKKTIRDNADPALAKIVELLVPKTEEIRAIDPSLGERREELARAGRHLAATGGPAIERFLQSVESAQLAVALAPSRTEVKAMRAVVATARELDPGEFDGIVAFERLRLLLGLQPMRVDRKLVDCARDHSEDMHVLEFFSHESPVKGKKTFAQRARRFGTRASAENLSRGPWGGAQVIDRWWHSPGHFKNLLRKSDRRVGLGRHEEYWTLLVGP